MVKYRTVILFTIGLFLISCIGVSQKNKIEENSELKSGEGNSRTKDSLIVILQPFEDINGSLTNYVYLEIKKIIPLVKLNKPISFPSGAYYKPRNRYKADSLLSYFDEIAKDGEVYIGLTSKDISTSKDNIPDWGVMGLSYCPGNACVVSTFRLNKTKLEEQFFKVAIHELGHTQGLGHCRDKTCLMRDAEGKNCTDEEVGFCPNCKAYLEGKGWKLL
jgi:archaemetzincin